MTTRAADIMTRDVVIGTPDETMIAVAKRLAEHGISALPLCDRERHVIGMVTEGDLLRPLRRSVLQKRARWLDLLAEGDRLSDEFVNYLKSGNHPVRDLMTTNVVSVSEETTLSEMAELMVDKKIKRIPVVKDGVLVGIVSRADIIRALVRADNIEA
ncbi:MAG TPA: CBS domain-containing protein [Acidisoma sp.]|jgi:CBS domain-containing protein|nr:CBS domain-containing protein [Acidisoma sp.]